MALRRIRMTINTTICSDELPILDPSIRVENIDMTRGDDIGQLMYDAYVNTIDYDDETLADAIAEVNSTLQGKYGSLLSACSFVALSAEDEIVSAALLVMGSTSNKTLLAYTMTKPAFQGRGLCKYLVKKGLLALAKANLVSCELVVTEGNISALKVYQDLGFVQADC